MDEETLKADPKALGGSSLNDFRALYASMKAEDSTEVRAPCADRVGAVEKTRRELPRQREDTPHHDILP